MKVELAQQQFTPDLLAALRDAGCDCQDAPDGSITAVHPAALDDHEERVELTFFLRAWGLDRGVAVRVVG